jgi:hypothetical protein
LSGVKCFARIQLADIESSQNQEPDGRCEREHQYSYWEQVKHDESLHNWSDNLSLAGNPSLTRVALALASARGLSLPIILCFYSGSMPPFSAPMPRDPSPPDGSPFNEHFPDVLANAVLRNEAVHDGAIMLGRNGSSGGYKVTGWSHRLHPPAMGIAVQNKGSAFNSCAAMSCVPGVDVLYLISRDGTFAFQRGAADRVDI